MLAQQRFNFRLFGYLAVVAAVFQAVVLSGKKLGWFAVIEEGGLIEVGQVVALSLAAATLLSAACHRGPRRGLYALLAVVASLAVVRELNYLAFYKETWWAPLAKGGLAGALMVAILSLDRRNLLKQAVELTGRHGFSLLLLGGVLFVGWAQILGQPRTWIESHGPGTELMHSRRLVEEGLELAGCLMICFGVLEEWLNLRAVRKADREAARPALAIYRPAA